MSDCHIAENWNNSRNCLLRYDALSGTRETEENLMSNLPFVNIAAYKFAKLDSLSERQRNLKTFCKSRQLRGTILLSQEGLNAFVAGPANDVDEWLNFLRKDPLLADVEIKVSYSQEQPFNRMLVKIKKEIIAFGIEEASPLVHPTPKISPRELCEWLDEGRPVALLDVRNDYEVAIGTFENAIPARIDHFRHFPQAVQQLDENLKSQPVVMFCTGGIRCEKAAPFMQQAGFENVFQLEGGILKYFEECGGKHYDGECFVFDKRVAVKADLAESDLEMCYVCQSILQPNDQRSEKYVVGVSCPNCFDRTERQASKSSALATEFVNTPKLNSVGHEQLPTRDQRLALLRQVTSPLPGCTPRDNWRPVSVPERCDRMTALDFLCQVTSFYSREQWQTAFLDQLVTRREVPLKPDQIVRSGWRIRHLLKNEIEPAVATEIELIFEDATMIVLTKPAPLPMHPCGRFHRNTLSGFLETAWPEMSLRSVHRLDANTSGLVLFAKDRTTAHRLQQQFAHNHVRKTYLALIHGIPEDDTFSIDAPISRESGKAGTRTVANNGLKSLTEITLLTRDKEKNQAIVSAKPVTGRTNQIRVHLWHVGFPIVGDETYLQDGQLAATQTKSLESSPLCLHAWKIELNHPSTLEPLSFIASPPSWTTTMSMPK
jgi:UPF0176 protein